MKQQFFAWLARELLPALEPLIRTAAAEIVAEIERELERRAMQRAETPTRKFIGQ